MRRIFLRTVLPPHVSPQSALYPRRQDPARDQKIVHIRRPRPDQRYVKANTSDVECKSCTSYDGPAPTNVT